MKIIKKIIVTTLLSLSLAITFIPIDVFAINNVDKWDGTVDTSWYDNHENDSEYQTWLNEMLRRSQFKYGLNVSVNDKVLTLSSCFDTKGTRVVLHAKLIKKEVR